MYIGSPGGGPDIAGAPPWSCDLPASERLCDTEPQLLGGWGCYATAVLSAQEGFRGARSRLQEIVKDVAQIVIFYPKFHCELNWIGYYWDVESGLHCKPGRYIDTHICEDVERRLRISIRVEIDI